MEWPQTQILVGLGLSTAYLIWYGCRKWHYSDCACQCCQLKSHTAHGFIIEAFEDWFRYEQDVIEMIYSARLIVIDCKWRNRFPRGKIALLAFTTSADRVMFVRLSHLGEFPDELAKVLSDPGVLKVGMHIAETVAQINADFRVQVNGWLDIRHMALATPAIKRQLIEAKSDLSLASMTETILGYRLKQDDGFQYFDWEKTLLSDEQIYHVTTRTISTFCLAVEIARANNFVSRALGHLLKPYLWLEHFISNQYSSFIGRPFRVKRALRPPRPAQVTATDAAPADVKKRKLYTTLKSPFYDNSVLLCLDFRQLCFCTKGKAQWYLKKGLAELVCDEPLIVRLSFQPAQPPMLASKYYRMRKLNKCVKCASADNLVRKHVVPRQYQRHFPKILKQHHGHDTILLCVECHAKFCELQTGLKRALAVRCDAPLTPTEKKFIEDDYLKKVRCAANVLNLSRDRLPETRRQELELLLRNHFGVAALSEEHLKLAAQINFRRANTNFVSHGKKVVDYWAKSEGLIWFQMRWRQFFLVRMKPSYLPDVWSKNHNNEIVALKIYYILESDPDAAGSLMDKLGMPLKYIDNVLQYMAETEKEILTRLNFKRERLLDSPM